jgi:hypothetical protein
LSVALAVARSAPIAVALSVPWLFVSIVFELCSIVVWRLYDSTRLAAVWAPVRNFVLLSALALTFESVAGAYANWLGAGLDGLGSP